MAWSTVANLKGPQGEQGPQGPQGPQGVQGVPGEAGADGAGIEFAGSVPTYAELPTGLTEADAGDGYYVEASGLLYIWSGTAFPAQGEGIQFRGPQGPQGPAGEQGATGATGAQGIQGEQGPQGPSGAAGVRGATWYTGDNAPGEIPGSMPGDLYLDRLSGAVYVLS